MLHLSKTEDNDAIIVDFTPDRDYVFIKFGETNEVIMTRVDAERLAFNLETLFLAEEFEDNVKP
jgi:hypothetical protein